MQNRLHPGKANDWLIFFIVLRPAQKSFTHADVNMSVNDCKKADVRRSGPLSKEGAIFIVPYLLWHRVSVYPVSSESFFPISDQADSENQF
jgi:hypothetical protein